MPFEIAIILRLFRKSEEHLERRRRRRRRRQAKEEQTFMSSGCRL
jgi:hypothetical protein